MNDLILRLAQSYPFDVYAVIELYRIEPNLDRLEAALKRGVQFGIEEARAWLMCGLPLGTESVNVPAHTIMRVLDQEITPDADRLLRQALG